MATKVLAVLLTSDKHAHLVRHVWDRVRIYDADVIVVTEDNQKTAIEAAQGLPLEVATVDYKKLDEYMTHPHFRHSITHWRFRDLFSIAETRNYYLGLAKDYDYLLHIDGDVLPPEDGLDKLLAEKKDHIGGIAYSDRPDKHKGWYVDPRPTEEQLQAGSVYECAIIGGCFCLESNRVINIPYILPDLQPVASDAIPRCLDIVKAGFKNYCHAGVICQHLT